MGYVVLPGPRVQYVVADTKCRESRHIYHIDLLRSLLVPRDISSKFLNDPLQDPPLHGRIEQHSGDFDLSGNDIRILAFPMTIFRKRARLHDPDRWQVNFTLLKSALMLGVGGDERVK